MEVLYVMARQLANLGLGFSKNGDIARSEDSLEILRMISITYGHDSYHFEVLFNQLLLRCYAPLRKTRKINVWDYGGTDN